MIATRKKPDQKTVGLLKVAEAGLALGPKGRFQSEAEKELRPGACEEVYRSKRKKPDRFWSGF